MLPSDIVNRWSAYRNLALTDDGSKLFFRAVVEAGYYDDEYFYVYDVASKASRDVAWTYGLNGFSAHLSRSGRYVLVNGEYGDDGTYYQTLIDLDSDTSRDTWSYHMMSRWGSTSNITEDDRYFFYAYDNNDTNSGLYRVDTRSTGDDLAPYVHYIRFSQPALLDEDDVAIAVQAKISAPGGLERIDRVTLLPLIDGHEDPAYPMGRAPLAFPHGDPGSTLLYDDGSHGDAVAEDGIFTFDGIATAMGGSMVAGNMSGHWISLKISQHLGTSMGPIIAVALPQPLINCTFPVRC